ncbi:MAG: 1-acyl-sn-glycerol-3-phosphate acyltransferase [candidate division Zixibacteria bacterium]|nr:1-acyl-sn-glycerol-3-phosphate acyltransferase [candidate division Zixibacteria bacterium]
MPGIIVLDPNRGDTGEALSERVSRHLQAIPSMTACERITHQDYRGLCDATVIDTLVYFPALTRDTLRIPDPEAVAAFAQAASGARIRHLVAISSAEVYGARPHNPGLIPETQSLAYGEGNRIAAGWGAFETTLADIRSDHADFLLTIFRPAPVLLPGATDYFARLLSASAVFVLAGHDPTLQWLHPDDLGRAVATVVAHSHPGVYNIAPSQVMTLRTSLRLAGVLRIPTPRWPQRLFRRILPASIADPIDRIEYIRYGWTVSDARLRQETGFAPQHTSVDAVSDFLSGKPQDAGYAFRREKTLVRRKWLPEEFDDYGLDKPYMAAYSRTMFRFFADFYWRIEFRGMEHIPREGRVLLAGVHRGFMPLDGVATNYLIHRETGRYCRFLIHPTLIKFPFQFNFMTKIGGMIACQQNADYVLSRDGMVGFYPEGIQGAFRYIKGVYNLGKFSHNEFIRMALRNRAPIVPFVTVGHAEIFPIVAKIKWRWWMRFTLWPAFPIAPPFPFLSIPLPTKWHVRFLEPLHVEREYPPEAGEDPRIVTAISLEIRRRMQAAIDEMLARRKRIFWGSIFET